MLGSEECDQLTSRTDISKISKFEGLYEIRRHMLWIALWFIVVGFTKTVLKINKIWSPWLRFNVTDWEILCWLNIALLPFTSKQHSFIWKCLADELASPSDKLSFRASSRIRKESEIWRRSLKFAKKFHLLQNSRLKMVWSKNFCNLELLDFFSSSSNL